MSIRDVEVEMTIIVDVGAALDDILINLDLKTDLVELLEHLRDWTVDEEYSSETTEYEIERDALSHAMSYITKGRC